MKNIFLAIVITAGFYTFWIGGNHPQAFNYINNAFSYIEKSFAYVQQNLAAVLMHKPITVAELQGKYNEPAKKVRVLVVAGHEPGYGGTEFGGVWERELNVELAKNLVEFLRNNGRYDVMLSRDDDNWNPVFTNYFKTQWSEIEAFFRDNKNEMVHKVSTGAVAPQNGTVKHNSARTDVALRLYGINKWENENAVDIAIHVHFNDYPRRDMNSVGQYTGFAMYVPEHQYANSTTTRAVAETVFKRIAKYNAVSNLPMEDEGIVEEPELIAIGAYNTTNAASMLVEYGYIYEPQFQNEAVRHSTLRDLAFQTYLGLQDFFGSGNDVSFAYDTLMLPHSWKGEVSAEKASTDDALALQSALLLDGDYPGAGKTKNDCPRTGKIGPCTLNALESFQKKYGIKGESGVVGEKTRALLNSKYSVKSI